MMGAVYFWHIFLIEVENIGPGTSYFKLWNASLSTFWGFLT